MGQPAWNLVGVVVLLLALHGAQAHEPLSWKPRPDLRQKFSDSSSSTTGSSNMVVGVRAPPSGEPLMPECVPKFVTELVLPLPMPTGSKQDPGCFNFADIVPRNCKQYGEQDEQQEEEDQHEQQQEEHQQQGPKFTPLDGYEGIGLIDHSKSRDGADPLDDQYHQREGHDSNSNYHSRGSRGPREDAKNGGYEEEVEEDGDHSWEKPKQQRQQQQQPPQQQRNEDYASREQQQQQQSKRGGSNKGQDSYYKQQGKDKHYAQDDYPSPDQRQAYDPSPRPKAPNSYRSKEVSSDDDDAPNSHQTAPGPARPQPDDSYSSSKHTLHRQFRRIPRKGSEEEEEEEEQQQQQLEEPGDYAGQGGGSSAGGGGGGSRQRHDKQHVDRRLGDGDSGHVKDMPVLPAKPITPILLDEFAKNAVPLPKPKDAAYPAPPPQPKFVYDEPAPSQQQHAYPPPPQQQQGAYPPQPQQRYIYNEPLPEQAEDDKDAYQPAYEPQPQQPKYVYDTDKPAELASLAVQAQEQDDDAYQPANLAVSTTLSAGTYLFAETRYDDAYQRAVLASVPELEQGLQALGDDAYQPAKLAVSRWGNPRASKSAATPSRVQAKDTKSEGQVSEEKKKSDQQLPGTEEFVPEDRGEPARLERLEPQATRKAGRVQKSQKKVEPLQQSPKIVDPGYEQPYGCEPPSEFKEYRISVKRVKQEVLPVGQKPLRPSNPRVTCPLEFKKTPVLAYGPKGMKGRHNWPAFTIEAQRFTPNRVMWVNSLKDDEGNHLPHLLDYAVDQTLHWANPEALGGVIDSSPCRDCSSTYPGDCANNKDCKRAASGVYSGPVPIVTHVHGTEGVRDHSDGYPEAWYMPDGEEETPSFKQVGSWYNPFQHEYSKETCQPEEAYEPGSATYLYPNMQRPSTAWYHDNTLGLARLNVYAGMSGFYMVRKFFPTYSPEDAGPELPGLPYPPPGGAEDPADIRELPLVIQDRVFEQNSKFWYPVADVPKAMAFPAGVQPPLWIPGFTFGPDASSPVMMTVNGKTWPKKTIAPDTYRLRLLNGCNTRTLQLQFARTTAAVKDLGNANKNTPLYSPLPFHVVGNGAGFFPQLQGPFTSLLLGPAERYDIIIDLSALTINDHVYMINTGPESLYDGTNNGETSMHTSQLMRFEFTNPSASRLATTFNFNYDRQASLNEALLHEALGEGHEAHDLPPSERHVSQMALIEAPNPKDDTVVRAVLLGTAKCDVDSGSESTAAPRYAHEGPCTELATREVEEWDIINLTEDAHPIHVHGVFHQVVEMVGVTVVDDTDPLKPVFVDNGSPTSNPDLDRLLWIDCPKALSASKKCMANRDTTLLLPGTRTRIRMRTGKVPGVFVWGSTQLEHKDNAMMLPFCLGQPRYRDPKNPEEAFCEGHLQATQSGPTAAGSSGSANRNQSDVVT